MRILKRGTRGEDVLLWQQFLLQLRADPKARFLLLPIRLDGIFGRETAEATKAFQRRFALVPDGIVGAQTYGKARALGFLDRRAAFGTPGVEQLGPLLGPYASQLRNEPPPSIAARAEPSPPPPAPGNTREQTFRRLRAEPWQNSPTIIAALREGHAVFQLLKDGAGDYVYDEYSIIVDAMPPAKTPEGFLEDMAADLNGTVRDSGFDTINVFRRRRGGKAMIGEVIDIDIMGPDNGSVILVESTPTYFVFQTVDSDKMGSHPENGSREFGFERLGSGFRFYTRGVSRPGNFIVRLAGTIPQRRGWTRLMMGISNRVVQVGGTSSGGSFQMFKEGRP